MTTYWHACWIFHWQDFIFCIAQLRACLASFVPVLPPTATRMSLSCASYLRRVLCCRVFGIDLASDGASRNENSNVYERRLKYLVYCLESASQIADDTGEHPICSSTSYSLKLLVLVQTSPMRKSCITTEAQSSTGLGSIILEAIPTYDIITIKKPCVGMHTQSVSG